jgi:hypothetical protein
MDLATRPITPALPYGRPPHRPLSGLAIVAILLGLALAALLFLRLAAVTYIKAETALLVSRYRGQPAAAVEADLSQRGMRVDATYAADLAFPPATPVEREEHFLIGNLMVRVRSQQGKVVSLEALPAEFR